MLLAEPASPDALGQAQWLVRRHAITHTTSPQALVKVRGGAPASTAARPYIGFGNFVPPSRAQFAATFPADRCADDAQLAAGLGAMPGTGTEVLMAARYTGGDARSAVLGQDFTVAALRAANLESYRIIHLATHALLPGELSCVTEPAIIASPTRGAPNAASAFLRSSEVLSIRLDADLVILSACNTAGPGSGVAEGAGNAGEALSGLARSFFYAGARGLLATHWYADDEVATLMVADLMRRQAAGSSSAAALRGAQLLLLEQAGNRLPAQFAHPYYWAVFAMIGDGRRQPAAQRVAAL
jgi:CHAT domain-containing protein